MDGVDVGAVLWLTISALGGSVTTILLQHIREYHTQQLLKKGHFAGDQWQRNFFNASFSLALGDNTQRNKVQGIVLSCGIKGWTEKDLLKYYPEPLIHLFYLNIDWFIRDSFIWTTEIYNYNKHLYFEYYKSDKKLCMERISEQCYSDDMRNFLKEYNTDNTER